MRLEYVCIYIPNGHIGTGLLGLFVLTFWGESALIKHWCVVGAVAFVARMYKIHDPLAAQASGQNFQEDCSREHQGRHSSENEPAIAHAVFLCEIGASDGPWSIRLSCECTLAFPLKGWMLFSVHR